MPARLIVAAHLLTVVSAFLPLVHAQEPVSLTGQWAWTGPAGWQCITLDLEADGTRLSGTISMGPGKTRGASPEEYWEYFFEPVVFGISDGSVRDGAISFDQVTDDGAILRYRGFVDRDRIALTRELVGAETGLVASTRRVEFTLERVP